MDEKVLEEMLAEIETNLEAKKTEDIRVLWLMGMGYSLSQIQQILEFDGFFIDD